MKSSHTLRSRLAAAATTAAAVTAFVAAPGTARADRKDTLAEQPAVRHRLLLVAKRLEATPMFESTINAVISRSFFCMGAKVVRIPNLPGTRGFGQNWATRSWPIAISIAIASPPLSPVD